MKRRTVIAGNHYVEVEQQPDGGWDVNTYRKGIAPHPVERHVGLTWSQAKTKAGVLAGGYAVEALDE